MSQIETKYNAKFRLYVRQTSEKRGVHQLSSHLVLLMVRMDEVSKKQLNKRLSTLQEKENTQLYITQQKISSWKNGEEVCHLLNFYDYSTNVKTKPSRKNLIEILISKRD